MHLELNCNRVLSFFSIIIAYYTKVIANEMCVDISIITMSGSFVYARNSLHESELHQRR